MRSLFEARLVNDTFGDPGLYVDFRDEHRALLFDLGDITVLPPRKLMRLSEVFVTHTHMDHFAGFDHLCSGCDVHPPILRPAPGLGGVVE